jgi:hypothetical protein
MMYNVENKSLLHTKTIIYQAKKARYNTQLELMLIMNGSLEFV